MKRNSQTCPSPNRILSVRKLPFPSGFAVGLAVALVIAIASTAWAANIAPEGAAIMGVNDAIDSDAGTLHYNAGVAANINDDNVGTRVDDWFGNAPTDMGQSNSFVGILWPSKRYDPISGLTLTLATFADGGWFGTSGFGPGPGGILDATNLIAPTIQVTTDGGVTWSTIDSDSDYVFSVEGHSIGGGANPNPTTITAPFYILDPITRINGIRLIGQNGGNAGADANGFIGVFELAVESTAFTDTDGDGLPDEWETDNGLTVGVNDAASDGDSDGLDNLGEYNAGADPNVADTDGDGLNDGDEVSVHMTSPINSDTDGDGLTDDAEINTHMSDPLLADTDGDGLADGEEVNTYGTDPTAQDSDGDGFLDPFEIAQGSDPNDAGSFPNNFALTGTGLMGTRNTTSMIEVDYYHAGAGTSINDGDDTTHVDDWNGDQATVADTESYVGILWDSPITDPIVRLELTLATFLDGGWFGVNGSDPGAGGALNDTYLVEPRIEVSSDHGTTWTVVSHTSDYIDSLTGHPIGGGGQPNPSTVSATFVLDTPVMNIDGIRIIGSEGGTASGGFIGVYELAVRGDVSDADGDGMDDDWERLHGLTVGTDDSAGDADSDGLTNLEEFTGDTDPQAADTDGDGLNDGAEVHTHSTNPLLADTDGDNVSDGDEINVYSSDPLLVDSDGDGYNDGIEVLEGSDLADASSYPNNFSYLGTGILGVKDNVSSGAETLVFNAGSQTAINDGNLNSRVDSYRDTGETASFVGILWDTPLTQEVASIQFTICTFFDGGWFGPNNTGPGSGGALSNPTYLTEPNVEVTTDGGTTWTVVGHTSDYLTVLDGHPLPAVDFGPPTSATTTFILDTPQTGIDGIRLIGPEGGTASGGFLGVWEFAVRGVSADMDGDGMDDAWESAHGLVVGTNDADSDADSDGLTNVEEFQADTDPQVADTDGDGLNDGEEVHTHNTDPLLADTDTDGLSDADEVNTYGTNPTVADSDSDGVLDGSEVALGSDPLDPLVYPINVAQRGTGLMGTKTALDSGTETNYSQQGTFSQIVDGNLSSRVDTYNGGQPNAADTVSFVGVQWTNDIPEEVFGLRLRLATFGDGGWFGVNNMAPAAGGPLTPAQLVEPRVEVTTDGGATWTTAAHSSDYLTVADGHLIGGGGQPNPTALTSIFTLDTPTAGINGIRIIGTEGGTASAGFLGVFELEAFIMAADDDSDGLEDSWERLNGLTVGVDDSADDTDSDGLTNLQEQSAKTNPQASDTDDDGLSDGDELNTANTNPLVADSDGDGVSDGDEVNTYGSNPLAADSDGDGFNDGYEVLHGADPVAAASIPANVAILGGAVLGTKPALDMGTETFRYNSGVAANINDGNLATRVDDWNGNIASVTDTVSFVGILWTNDIPAPITNLVLTLATFGDGGWFGVNNLSPAPGEALTPSHLAEPIVQVTVDGGATWTMVPASSDYMTALDGHLIGGGGQPNPTQVAMTFTLDTPATAIDGIRIIGTEGGVASGGFVGIFELEANAPSGGGGGLLIGNVVKVGNQIQFEFDSENGVNYEVQSKDSLDAPTWNMLMSITGDGTRQVVTDTITGVQRIYRVMAP